MRYFIFYLLLFVFVGNLFSQSENCSGAITLTVLSNCSSPVSGSTGLSENIPGCVGNADDDVWYQFVATSTSHQITVVPSAGLDPVVQLFSGTCSALASISCMDNGLTGQTETIFASGLTVGATYRIRVYHYYTGGGSPNTFTICVTTPPPPPSNDACGGAISLTINTSCNYTNATSLNASQSLTGCVGTADDDVWFSFVATNSVHTITVDPSSNMDPVVQLYSGTCSTLQSITCMDNGFTDGNEVINAVGLTVGNTYYVRVYDYYSSSGGFPFQICVTGTPSPTPPNDDPCGAIALPAVTSACNYLNFSTTGATTSTGPGIPTPASCAGGASPQQGGFNNSPQPKDVWFSIVVPSTGNVTITAQPGYGISDVVMALYSGTCNSLTQIACSDDYNYPGAANDMKPFINATGLTPGSTVYLRYWAFNGNTTGNIGFCVSTNTHDNCSNALYICDLNGYSGTTSAAFTTDRPCNMRGNAEMNNAPTYTYTPGTCQPGGIFGLGGPWGVGAPNCDVRIDNNSWIRFTAANTTATLNVNVYGCFVGNYPSGGIQMQIFSVSSPCCGFTPVSDFKEGSGTFTITANNLTVGQDYYLMIDGFAGDICSYTITANSGVQFPDITASSNPICAGSSVTLYGPAGASSYEWQPGGQTTQNITVNPSTTTTYTLEVTGVCGARQTLSKTITVNQPPDLSAINNNITVCAGQTINLSASGGSSYQWVGPNSFNTTLQNPSIPNASAANAGTYTVTVTSAAGCTNSAQVLVTVNANPTPSISGTNVICAGQTTTFTSTAANAYLWNTGSTNQSINISNAGTYTVTVTGANGCTATATRTLTVNSLPTIAASSNSPVCVGNTIQLNSSGGTTYQWSGPSSFTSGSQNPTIPAATIANSGTYVVTVSGANGCTNSTSISVTVNTLPTINNVTTTNPTLCGTNDGSITINATGSGTLSYSINGGANFSSNNTFNGLAAGTYQVVVMSSNGCSVSGGSYNITNGSAPPAPLAGSNQTICAGQTASNISATTGSGGSIKWYSNASLTNLIGTNNTLNPNPYISGPGIYNFYVTETVSGCESPFSVVTITVNPLPVINVSVSPNNICDGQTTTILSVSGGTSYLWNDNSTNPINIVTPTLSSNTYTVTVTDMGCSTSTNIVLNVSPLPSFNAQSNSPACSNNEINLSITGYPSGSTVVWSGPNGFTSTNINENITNAVESTHEGNYTVVLTDLNGCTKSQTIFVDVITPPSSSIDPVNPICANASSIQLSVANSGGTWSGTGVNNSGVFDPQLAGQGTHTISYTIPGICPSTSTINIQVLEAPDANATYNGPLCEGQDLIISGNTPSAGSFSAYWVNSGNTISNQPVDTFSNASTLLNGVYWYYVQLSNGCKDSISLNVQIKSLPVITNVNISNKTCSDVNNGSIDITTSGTGYNFTWSTGANSEDITNLSEGTYTVTVDNNGCSVQQSYTIASPEPLEIVTIEMNKPTCNSTNGSILISVSGGTPSYTYQWQPSVSNDSIANNISEGNYTVQVTDQAGCTASLSINLTCTEVSLIIPELITPNGDGINDTWEISNIISYPESSVIIMNRWGDKVFVANPYLNDWSGQSNTGLLMEDQKVTDGTYFFVLTLKPGEEPIKGFIELRK